MILWGQEIASQMVRDGMCTGTRISDGVCIYDMRPLFDQTVAHEVRFHLTEDIRDRVIRERKANEIR